MQVGPRRWKVELNARLDGVLMLSSVNLPGGIQVIYSNVFAQIIPFPC
jgi:exosome complex RNA-binding protein Rrp4